MTPLNGSNLLHLHWACAYVAARDAALSEGAFNSAEAIDNHVRRMLMRRDVVRPEAVVAERWLERTVARGPGVTWPSPGDHGTFAQLDAAVTQWDAQLKREDGSREERDHAQQYWASTVELWADDVMRGMSDRDVGGTQRDELARDARYHLGEWQRLTQFRRHSPQHLRYPNRFGAEGPRQSGMPLGPVNRLRLAVVERLADTLEAKGGSYVGRASVLDEHAGYELGNLMAVEALDLGVKQGAPHLDIAARLTVVDLVKRRKGARQLCGVPSDIPMSEHMKRTESAAMRVMAKHAAETKGWGYDVAGVHDQWESAVVLRSERVLRAAAAVAEGPGAMGALDGPLVTPALIAQLRGVQALGSMGSPGADPAVRTTDAGGRWGVVHPGRVAPLERNRGAEPPRLG